MSYAKVESLNYLKNKGFNVHIHKIVDSLEELEETIKDFNYQCSVRTDLDKISQSLPFYMIEPENRKLIMQKIWKERDNPYKYIVSAGSEVNAIQLFNLVAKIDKQGNFLCEASDVKGTLRHMYAYPLFSASGNIAEEISEWEIFNPLYGLDRRDVKNVLGELYTKEIWNHWFEVTVYPINVGILNEKIIYWQII